MAGNSVKTNLIINYLPYEMSKQEFAEMCEKVGPISSYKLVTDVDTGLNLGYGFVSYKNSEDAYKAIDVLNGKYIGSKVLNVRFADHEAAQAGITLFVSGLPVSYSIPDIKELFKDYGEILNIRLLSNYMDDGLKNREAFAFVKLSDKEQAERAIITLNGSTIQDKDGINTFRLIIKNPPTNARKLNQTIAQFFKNKTLKLDNGKMVLNKRVPQRYSPYPSFGMTNQPYTLPSTNVVPRNGLNEIFVNGLRENDEHNLYELFRPYGDVQSIYVPKDSSTGSTKGYGFVNMVNNEDAKRAIMDLDGIPHGSRFLQVSLKSTKNFPRPNPQFGMQLNNSMN
ncbi:hypothetical protein O3M35_000357 [Rhynocoris fuscipes]|uniref:RRM domain-containing protein n=1 Tax=Rhynocoris fuscipes TaxID=488301 RepID=A0AAW1DN46_9HEMI